MPAYVVSIRRSTSDPAALALYAADAPRAGAAAGRRMKRLATSSGRLRVLAGDPVEGASILEFDTFDEAQAWFDSDEYQHAVRHLFAGAEYQMLVVEGETEVFGPMGSS
jgi:uncharacterized protein (DUF1330 family)